MSASVVSSSRRRPVRCTSLLDRREAARRLERHASTRASRCCRSTCACGLPPALVASATTSIIVSSSDPHLAHRSGGAARLSVRSNAAMACPMSFRSPFTYMKPEPDGAVLLDAAQPVGLLHVDRMEPHAAALRVLDERGRVVEPHRLVVEERRVERRRVVHLEIRARVGEQREAGGVRLGKAVERERRDRRDDALGGLAGDAVRSPSPRAAACSICFMRFSERLKPIARRSSSAWPPVKPAATIAMRSSCSWKSGTPSVRASTGSSERVQRHHRLAPGAAIEIRVHHLPDDRARADDRHLHHEVVEASSASAAAASPSARATPPGRRRWCRPSAAARRRAGSSGGMCASSNLALATTC